MEDRADTCPGTSAGARGWGQTLVHERNLSTHCSVRDTDILEAMPLYYTRQGGEDRALTTQLQHLQPCVVLKSQGATRGHHLSLDLCIYLLPPPGTTHLHPFSPQQPVSWACPTGSSLSTSLLPGTLPFLTLSPLYPLSPTIKINKIKNSVPRLH